MSASAMFSQDETPLAIENIKTMHTEIWPCLDQPQHYFPPKGTLALGK
jgi:hypothetical protein